MAVVAVAGTLFGAAQARADQVPQGCRASTLSLSVERSLDTVRNGEVVRFTLKAFNNGANACNVTDATFQIIAPAADGSPTGESHTLGVGVSVPAGATDMPIGFVDYTAALNPGVATATARATVLGTAHDQVARVDPASDSKDISVGVAQPALSLTKVASPTSGNAPLTVTYTYTVKNISTTSVDAIAQLGVVDNLCSPAAGVLTGAGHNVGDGNQNDLLDVGETFTFTCTTTHPNPGTYVDTANACGNDVQDKDRVCAPPANATVVVNAPLVVAASKCVSVPKTLSLRAKELTTVKVTVNAGDGALKGAKVTIKGPGISRSAKTNDKGVAIFKVRPTRKGTLTISSDRCLQAMQSSVKAARKTQSRQLPRNTG